MFEMMRAVAIDPAVGSARGRAHVAAEHPMFADHFVGAPVLPATVAVELAAQLAGPLAEEVVRVRHGVDRWAVLGMIRNAKILAPSPLPVTLELSAEVTRVEPAWVIVRTDARVDDVVRLRAELALTMVEERPEWRDAVAARRTRVAGWKEAW